MYWYIVLHHVIKLSIPLLWKSLRRIVIVVCYEIYDLCFIVFKCTTTKITCFLGRSKVKKYAKRDNECYFRTIIIG